MDCSTTTTVRTNYCWICGTIQEGKERHSYRSWWTHATTLMLAWKTIRFIHST